MTIAALARGDTVFCDDPAIFSAILLPGVTLAEWRRKLPDAAVAWLTALDPDRIDDLDFVCPVAAARAEVFDGLAQANYPADPGTAWLADDIADLIARYAATLDLADVALRLEIIDTDACRRFHADVVTARAICTYRGPGTQWLDDAAIRDLGTGDVGLMKGRLWSNQPLVHRSPPIAQTGQWRLVLVLNPPGPADCATDA